MEVSSPFGSPTRTRILLALQLLEQSYPRELARLLGTPLSVVQKALKRLEGDGLIAARSLGRTRLFTLNRRYFGYDELVRFLKRLNDADDSFKALAAGLRRRPRRTGKRL
jgi:DNA-binding transcriptional ArsR family regulator